MAAGSHTHTQAASRARVPGHGETVLEARNVAKSYGAVHALKGVNFEVKRGQVTTLFGENGAGKSTLMKILSGVVTPTSGQIVLDGQPVVFSSSNDARARGISIIHQELSLAPNLPVRDNIFMGREITGPTGVDFSEEERQARALMEDLGENIDPLTPVEELRLGQQQIVEIARALSVDSRILIMDEPTSALSASEVERLFKVIHDLTSRGVAIVYISHHLEEALEITNHAVVLRDGTMTAYARREDIDLEWIVRHMVGENFDLGSPPTGYGMGDVALSIEGVSVADKSGADLVDRLSLDVRAGEIVCIYGLMGAGRTELLEAVAGRLPLTGGRVVLEGEDVSRLTIAQRIAKGLVIVPEDRQRDGLVQTMTVGENLSLASIGAFTRRLLTSRPLERSLISDSIGATRIKTAGGHAAIGSLSGGNQQKVVIGKMMATKPRVVLLDEPSRGIDVGAKAEVFRLLAEGAQRGLAVIYSTSEVGECLAVAHRIIVMHKGKIAAEFGPDVTKKQIMAASGEVDLRQQLTQAYGLQTCEVVSDLHRDDLPLEALGAAGGAFLSEEIAHAQKIRIGVSHGRTLLAGVENVVAPEGAGVEVVALMGGLTQNFSANPHEIAVRLAERTGGKATAVQAPFLANSASDRAVLLGQKGVVEAFDLAGTGDLVFVGIGTVGPQAELVTTGMIERADMEAIARAGGVGEMLGHFFNADGRPVETELTRRILTAPLDTLKGRRIVAVAGGAIKVDAVKALLESGLLTGLVTDEHTARAINEILRTRGGGRSPKRAGSPAHH